MFHDIFNITQRKRNTCRSIRVRKDNSTILSEIIFLLYMKVFIQCRPLIWNAEQFCPYIIKRIGDVRKQNWFLTVKKSKETHCQYIIRSHADKYLIVLKPILPCNGMHKIFRCRIRIKSQCICICIPKYLRNPRCRRIRIFICI